jgi:hypothetical protein
MSARAAREAVAAALTGTAGVFVVAHPSTLDPVDKPTAYVSLAEYDDGTGTGCAASWRVAVTVAAGDPAASPDVWDELDDAADAVAASLTAAGIHVTSNAPSFVGDRMAVRVIETESYA